MMAYNRHERLIPARAGKTRTRLGRVRAGRAHPRAGGENTCQPVSGDRVRGSSPRGRGKRPWWRRWPRRGRLIPARAGKTPWSPRHTSAGRAHPRAGGENSVKSVVAKPINGSSPRGRGKLEMRLLGRRGLGLIPARAGKTKRSQRQTRQTRAHPRAGGENTCGLARADIVEGSSPRGRGKRQGIQDAIGACGLIPARAGKTRRP